VKTLPYQPVADPHEGAPVAGGITAPITFGPFVMDTASARVFRDGQEIPLRPRVFRVLRFLIRNSGRLVEFDEMLSEAWGGAKVSKHTIAVTLRELKDLLGEYGSWITIRQGYGYTLEIPESEHLMRLGRHFRSQSTRSGLDNALRCFEQVTEMESGKAGAWEALAGLHIDIGFLSARAPRDVHRSFLRAYHNAVSLHGMTPGMQYYHGVSLYRFEWKLAEAEEEFVRLLRDNPKFLEARVRLAVVRFLMGRPEEAFEQLAEAEKADPLLPSLASVKTCLLLNCREVDAAAASARQTVALHPKSPLTHLTYADILDFQGDGAALSEYRAATTMAPDIPWLRAAEARCLARQGRSREALEILTQLQENRDTEYVDAYHLAFLLESLGERDAAFEELERAYADRSPMVVWLDRVSKADALRTDPRFAPFWNRVSSAVQSN
jgi:DNA-binding winged helix-turn-helix (wHTH) protein